MFFNKARRADASNQSVATTLAEAAEAALACARRETLALAHVAEQSGRAQYWFASNILTVVTVTASRPGEGGRVALTRALMADLVLSEDMAALVSAGDGQIVFTALNVSAAELERYLAWARTVY